MVNVAIAHAICTCVSIDNIINVAIVIAAVSIILIMTNYAIRYYGHHDAQHRIACHPHHRLHHHADTDKRL